ncbi:MAG: hypothetical protein L6R42_011183, partial [Xanthoria sp. 1 TBL-2021]
MGKFGFGKKGEDDEDSKRSALFSRSKNKSPNPATNPYAQPAAASDPYTQAKLRVSQGLPAREPSPGPGTTKGGGYGGLNAGGYGEDVKRGENGFPAAPASGGYGGPQGVPSNTGGASRYGGPGYGVDKYGASSGYGGDKYGTGEAAPQSNGGGSRHGPGGYGGLGPASAPDEDRDALFGGARE